ncbi:MAG: radical SAM protein [Salinivirgaceae bacterium]|jgi:pyruvate formate-lyase activating enzyme-like uncharacterized protein|nr:radical SAM protein [Salinivirgaceae bacterium]
MNAYFSYLNDFITKHKIAYSNYPEIKWLSPYEVADFQEKRDELLIAFKDSTLFKGTKPFLNGISKGCELCGKGLWSCLFITGKCNASCFYCPSAQDADDLPESQGMTFATPESYTEYIKHFKFKGVGFSGGEPLLVKERVLAYLKSLRQNGDPDLYIWMYTNGILGNKEIFAQLADAGLNEVRFDIGATNFKLDAIANAGSYFDNITIEIPAVPEEAEKLKILLPEMVEAGVTRLNLHQMRLTPYNVKKMITRNYTFIPAEQPIVLESELAALEIMNYAKLNNIPIAINYCSFFFKNRFQKAGFKTMMAKTLGAKEAKISEKGYIRNNNENGIRYDGIFIADKGRLNGNLSSLILPNKSYDYQQTNAFTQTVTSSDYKNLLMIEPAEIPQKKELYDIWNHEYIEKGLREY